MGGGILRLVAAEDAADGRRNSVGRSRRKRTTRGHPGGPTMRVPTSQNRLQQTRENVGGPFNEFRTFERGRDG